MNKIAGSMFVLLVFLLLGLGLESCEKQVCEDLLLNDLELYDLELYELVVRPCLPDSDDQISVIEKICGTETDVILSFHGNQIGYLRYVNSLMMAPCSPRLDTTIIGQLNTGSYQLVQSIIDKNHLITDSIILQDTITIIVYAL
jgi:hypothetical protein